MTILKNVVYTRKYTGRDGTERKQYLTVGQIHEGQYGQYLTLDSHINFGALDRKAGDNRVTLNLYDPKEREAPKGREEPRRADPRAEPGLDDDIPFENYRDD